MKNNVVYVDFSNKNKVKKTAYKNWIKILTKKLADLFFLLRKNKSSSVKKKLSKKSLNNL